MMHTSTSPQYGIIASCDVAAAMMEQPAGRALVQETIDEAMSFRRAMNNVRKQMEDSWWFRVWEPSIADETPSDTRAEWLLKPGDSWHGFEGVAENHVMVDPIKVTILSPGLTAGGTMDEHGIPAAVVTKFLSSRRIEIEKTGLYSFLVLFSMGVTRGKWSTLITELLNFKDLYDANAPLTRVLPDLVTGHTEAYGTLGLKDLCRQIHEVYRKDDVPRAEREMYAVLPDVILRPADAYNELVKGRVESVDIDELMGRTLAVMIAPYPPGIPLIMPGERITRATKSIQDYLVYAREFDQKFPGFETDIHGIRFVREPGERRYLVDCLKENTADVTACPSQSPSQQLKVVSRVDQ
ncbi:arginine/lysine/ornithine decarboxylase [Sinorhizobium fredii]|nr:hypothetical protein AB395_00006665 [Sinorhizobium fredii CCBAU 45436]GEC32553.1 hypothetical protein EFR01_27240 [Sinorhizobium fredii]GLS07029.1 hypothetical protein GCM10007864_06550 [Sinorhizobium fredii]CCE99092.1 hypothetical protein SFHH103_04619 [Sinorhizobium fredii HH103]CEO91777.1 Orn/Lys/Arg decarboxylase major domain [Sinorhizobium fredii HH103]